MYSPLGSRGLFDDNGYGSLLRASDPSAGVKFVKSLALDPDTEALEIMKYQNAVKFWLASAGDGPAVDWRMMELFCSEVCRLTPS